MSVSNEEVIRKRHLLRFGIRKKILLSFLATIMFFLVSVIITYYLLYQTYGIADYFLKKELVAYHRILDLQSMIIRHRIIIQQAVLNDQSKFSQIKTFDNEIQDTLHELDNKIDDLNDNNIVNKWKQVKIGVIDYLSKTENLISDNAISREQMINKYQNEILPSISNVTNLFYKDVRDQSELNGKNGILDVFDATLASNMQHIVHDLVMIKKTVAIFFLISVITSIIITIYLSRSIINPINYAIGIANEIAGGGRNIKINISRNDEAGELLIALSRMNKSIKESEEKIESSAKENRKLYDSIANAANLFGEHASLVASGDFSKQIDLSTGNLQKGVITKLGTDLNMMTKNLNVITSEILKTSKDIIVNLENVRSAMNDQSSGASEQASSINEITASIAEIDKSALQTMNKAKSLGEIAEKTRKNGQLGLDSIQNSISGIKIVKDKVQAIALTILELSKQTQQVGEITAVVNNLAQQSKMLALNASIEAAKAGEAGKGFAVVATEVKNLAEQSEQSTTQVQKILENIKLSTEKSVMVTEEGTKGVDIGLGLIEQTGQIIQNLNDVIREASITSQQIEAAVRQETSAIEQITAGMNEINTVTATFVASIKQTTTAMDDLNAISTKLKSSVEIYKI